MWQQFQGLILHWSTFLLSIIGSGSTLESNLWFGRSSQKSEGRYFHQRFTKWNICQDYEVSMRLVSLQMRGDLSRNYIFSLIWIYHGPKRYILDYWETVRFCLLSYYILSMDKVYRVEIMDIGKISLTHWCQWNMQMQPSQ